MIFGQVIFGQGREIYIDHCFRVTIPQAKSWRLNLDLSLIQRAEELRIEPRTLKLFIFRVSSRSVFKLSKSIEGLTQCPGYV